MLCVFMLKSNINLVCEEIGIIIVLMCCRMFDHINVIVHHKGKFRRDDHGTLVYVNGEYYVWEGFDKDLMIVWTINDMYKSYGCYQRFNVVYILVLESGLEGGLL